MKLLPQCLVALAFLAARSLAGEASYYQDFLRAFGTKNWDPATPVAASLIDTANTARKITNAVVDLKEVMASGGVSGVRLGMTMDEVVARWGKPSELHIINSDGLFSGSFRAARFRYSKVEVQFEHTTNAVRILSFDTRPLHLAGELMPRSTTNDVIAVLGRPTDIENVKGVFDFLLYRLPGRAMSVVFWSEDTNQMFQVQLERLPGGGW